jgi:hypothetical protein
LNQYIREKLCKYFCSYFKPLQKEDLACEGFIVIERLLRNGKNITFDRPDKEYDYGMQKMLAQAMCTVCPFYADDCDFIMAARSTAFNEKENEKEKPSPCGGFIFLTHLLESNIIKIDDIRNII